jgi:hypothetical protein
VYQNGHTGLDPEWPLLPREKNTKNTNNEEEGKSSKLREEAKGGAQDKGTILQEKSAAKTDINPRHIDHNVNNHNVNDTGPTLGTIFSPFVEFRLGNPVHLQHMNAACRDDRAILAPKWAH